MNKTDERVVAELNEKQSDYLKTKQTQNIIQKITALVQQVIPIHEEYYEDEVEQECEMTDLIESFGNMDVE